LSNASYEPWAPSIRCLRKANIAGDPNANLSWNLTPDRFPFAPVPLIASCSRHTGVTRPFPAHSLLRILGGWNIVEVCVGHGFCCWCREGNLNPQGAKHRRILSTQAGSDPFGKFSTLFPFSTGYKASELIRYDPKCSVLSMELLQFYYSGKVTHPCDAANKKLKVAISPVFASLR